MSMLISILIIITSILLILIVLVQNSKGGGLASNFSSSNQMLGVRKTTDFLEKATWTLAVALLVFSLLASITIQRPEDEEEQKALLEGSTLSLPDESGNNVGNWPSAIPEQQPDNQQK